MAELFQKDVRTISEHIKTIFEEGELQPDSVLRKFRITATDEKNYEPQQYSLDVIISAGYRVRSLRGTQFRIWVTQQLREFIVKGFVLDDERNPHVTAFLAGRKKLPEKGPQACSCGSEEETLE